MKTKILSLLLLLMTAVALNTAPVMASDSEEIYEPTEETTETSSQDMSEDESDEEIDTSDSMDE